MTSGAEPGGRVSQRLLVLIGALAILVLALGAAVLLVQLQPEDAPSTQSQRDVALWRQEVDETPDSAGAHTGLGLALLRDGDTAEARSEFEQALTLDPNTAPALLQLGLLTVESDPDTADRLIARAGETFKRTYKASAYLALGDLRMSREDLTGAREAYELAIVDSPYVMNGHLGLAKALEQLGDLDGAYEQYRRAADFDPDNEEVKAALARFDTTTTSP